MTDSAKTEYPLKSTEIPVTPALPTIPALGSSGDVEEKTSTTARGVFDNAGTSASAAQTPTEPTTAVPIPNPFEGVKADATRTSLKAVAEKFGAVPSTAEETATAAGTEEAGETNPDDSDEFALAQIHSHVDRVLEQAGLDPLYSDDNRVEVNGHVVIILKDRIIIPHINEGDPAIAGIIEELKRRAKDDKDPRHELLEARKTMIDKLEIKTAHPLDENEVRRANEIADSAGEKFINSLFEGNKDKIPQNVPLYLKGLRESQEAEAALRKSGQPTPAPAPLSQDKLTKEDKEKLTKQLDEGFRRHIKAKAEEIDKTEDQTKKTAGKGYIVTDKDREDPAKTVSDMLAKLGTFDTLKQADRDKFYSTVDSLAKDKRFKDISNFKDLQEAVRYNKFIDGLEKSQPKKAKAYRKAYALFNKQKLKDSQEPIRLQADEQKRYGQGRAFLTDKFESKMVSVTATLDFYDYKGTDGKEDYWVDFANMRLGGGCFEHGFVQEEIQFLEIPGLAKFLSGKLDDESSRSSVLTRIPIKGGGDGVGEGSPHPLIIKDLHRVQKIKGAYGSIDKFDPEQNIEVLDPPQKLNLLAMAAPKLPNKDPTNQFAVETLQDLLATIMAGFALVQEQATAEKQVVIHSGRIGCGVFNNSPKAVFLLHRLAAEHLGVEVKMHGYSDKDAAAYQAEWEGLKAGFAGQTLQKCMEILSTHLQGNTVRP